MLEPIALWFVLLIVSIVIITAVVDLMTGRSKR